MHTERCATCGRRVSLTRHHLIPKKMHGKTAIRKRHDKITRDQTIRICRRCHDGIHNAYSEKVLAEQYDTLQKLLDDPALQRHFVWAGKQKGGR